jgi:hypothetical protein
MDSKSRKLAGRSDKPEASGTSDREASPSSRRNDVDVSGNQSIGSLQREINTLRNERDAALQQCREWQTRASALKAELEKERGSTERVMITKSVDREKEIRRELQAELQKSEAAWKERIRNERLLRLSYERVLLNLGFSPNRIASDLVRVSRPQPLTDNPEDYRTVNLLQIDEALCSQTQSKRKGLFAYNMDQIRSGFGSEPNGKKEGSTVSTEEGPRPSGSGRRDLLRSLALATVPQ